MIENVWLILAALGISNVVEQIDRYVFQVSPIPFIEYDSYQYSLLAGTLFSVVYCVGVILFSLLNEKVKLDRITIVALSCGISSIALACIPFVTQFWHLAVLRLFMGFAQSPITVFCASFIKDQFVEEKRGIAFGIFNSGTFIGFALSLTLGTAFYDSAGWKAAYLFFGGVGILYAIITRAFISDPGSVNVALLNASNGNARSKHPVTSQLGENGGLATSDYHHLPGRQPLENILELSGSHPGLVGSDEDSEAGETSNNKNNNISNMELIGFRQIIKTFLLKFQEVWAYCSLYSSTLYVCLACGLRFAGGYQYANYIAIFFSDITKVQENDGIIQTCTYSFDNTPGNSNDTGAACGEDFPYCIDEQCNKLSSFPWHDVGMTHDQFETAFGVSTVVGSILGCVLGGYLGDWVAKNTRYGVSGRMIIAGGSLLISAPCYVLMYYSSYPACFVFLAFGGFFGEMYYGLSIAVLAEMIPQKLFTVTCSLYISILIAFGSNGTLLVPMLTNWLEADDTVDFSISAACTEANAQNEDTPGVQLFTASLHGGEGLQTALSWLIAIFYVSSGILFLVSVPKVKRDVMKIRDYDSAQAARAAAAQRDESLDNYGYVENAITNRR